MRRIVAISLLAFLSVWLNVIVPGHTRGIVSFASATRPAPQAVEPCGMCCDAPREPVGNTHRTPAPAGRNCAICYFAAHFGDAPPAPVGIDPPVLTCHVYPDQCQPLMGRQLELTIDGRAPPALRIVF